MTKRITECGRTVEGGCTFQPPVFWEIAKRQQCVVPCMAYNIQEDHRKVYESVVAIQLRREGALLIPINRIVNSYDTIAGDAPCLLVDFFNGYPLSSNVRLNVL